LDEPKIFLAMPSMGVPKAGERRMALVRGPEWAAVERRGEASATAARNAPQGRSHGAARTYENPSTWAQAGLKHRPYPCQREGYCRPPTEPARMRISRLLF